MNLICFAPMYNTPGRKDATGAFQPEAKRFINHHGLPKNSLVLVDNSKSKASMRRQVLEALYESSKLDGVFFFCHGFRTGIQFGFDLNTVDDLVGAFACKSNSSPVVCFYSCDVARDADRDRKDDLDTMGGDGGFADEVRDALCEYGDVFCQVIGHSNPGHCCRNPYCRIFTGDGSQTGGSGGSFIVSPSKKKLWTKWRSALKTSFRFDFPMMSVGEIYDYLGKI